MNKSKPNPHRLNEPKWKLVEKETGKIIETFRSRSAAIDYFRREFDSFQKVQYELLPL